MEAIFLLTSAAGRGPRACSQDARFPKSAISLDFASLLFAKGLLGSTFYVPFWVVLSCQVAMALGTLVGGWRIVKTMGSRITRLKPVQGFCAETAGAMTLYLATSFGVPVSTTHTITGAIMGVMLAGSQLFVGALPEVSSSPG